MNSNRLLEVVELNEKYTNDKEFRNAIMNKTGQWNDENIAKKEEPSTKNGETPLSISELARNNRIIKG